MQKDILDLESFVHLEDSKLEHHQIRIAIKRLRYTLEGFGPLFMDGLGPEISKMKDLQDVLGEMHDCDVWTSELPNMLSTVASISRLEEKEVRPGLDAIAEDRTRERHSAYERFVHEWDGLIEEKFFEELRSRVQDCLSMIEKEVPMLKNLGQFEKIALISDVHGNIDALNAVMADAGELGIKAYLNMGDMVGFGAYPEEVVKRLMADDVLTVLGNYDLKVLNIAKNRKKVRTEAAKGKIAAMAAKDLSRESRCFISGLPIEIRLNLSGHRALMTHSSPAHEGEHLSDSTPDERLREIAKIARSDIVLIGHSHSAFHRTVDATIFINPGSVGRPLDNDRRASYAILGTTNLDVEVRRVEYDLEAAAEAVIERGLPHEVARSLREAAPIKGSTKGQ